MSGYAGLLRCALLLTDNYALASQLLCEVDFVAGTSLDEVHIWQLVADLDESRS